MFEILNNTAAAESFYHSVELRAAQVVHLQDEAALRSVPGRPLTPGPVLALSVTEAVVVSALRQRGLHVKVGHCTNGSAKLLSLLLRAGRHVAACVADFGDPDVQSFVRRCVQERHMPLVMRTGSREVGSVSPLTELSRDLLAQSTDVRPAPADEYLRAVREHVALLQRDSFLRTHGIDARRVRSRSLLLQVPVSLDTVEEGGLQGMVPGLTLH